MKGKKYTLIGVCGNVYSIIEYTAKAMKDAGYSSEEVTNMFKEATSGNYSNLICVCDSYINKVNEMVEDHDDK